MIKLLTSVGEFELEQADNVPITAENIDIIAEAFKKYRIESGGLVGGDVLVLSSGLRDNYAIRVCINEPLPPPQPNDALLVACKLAARVMNDYGNATNWPPDMPMEYAEAVNALRAAINEAGAKE